MFTHVISRETWDRHLSEEDRAQLVKHLPSEEKEQQLDTIRLQRRYIPWAFCVGGAAFITHHRYMYYNKPHFKNSKCVFIKEVSFLVDRSL